MEEKEIEKLLRNLSEKKACQKSDTPLKSDCRLPKKICVICFIESPIKMIKNAFYFVLKALFVLKIFKFLSLIFGHVEKKARLRR